MASNNEEHDPQKLKDIENHLKSVGDEFMKLWDEYDLDIIISPGEGGLYAFSAVCGKSEPLSVEWNDTYNHKASRLRHCRSRP